MKTEEKLMNNYKHLKNVLLDNIKILSECSSLFTENVSDFSRNRKLNFKTVMMNVICMETGSLKDELLKLNEYSIATPTASAFIQARSKIKVSAFKTLFDNFNQVTHVTKTYKGYRLLAIDGSELPIDNTIYDQDTTVLLPGKIDQTYSAFHLNACYDLLEYTYENLIIQGEAKKDENKAFCQLVDNYKGKKAIFIADRNYESYNGFEHVTQANNKYLIRIKDIHSKTSMARTFGPYNEEEFDLDVHRILTLKSTKEIINNPQIYKYIPTNMRFDFLNKEKLYYDFNCRIVRFKLDNGSYECIVTNLSREEISIEEIKELYHMRWGIETSFREVKYAIGLNALHSKKRKLIKQEIYARLLLYNFSQRIIAKVKITKKDRQKYEYQVNFTRAFHIIRNFLKKKGGNPPIDNLIAKEILPVRPGRANTRKVRPKTVVCFNYRYD